MAKVKIYKAEADLKSYHTQAVAALRFYKPKQNNYQEISIKIDTGSAITLMRYLALKEQGIPYRELAQETVAVATNGGS